MIWIKKIFILVSNCLAIRDAGGAFSKLEVAHEEEYFYKKVIFYY